MDGTDLKPTELRNLTEAELHNAAQAASKAGVARAELTLRAWQREQARDDRREAHEIQLAQGDDKREVNRKIFDERLHKERIAHEKDVAQAEDVREAERKTFARALHDAAMAHAKDIAEQQERTSRGVERATWLAAVAAIASAIAALLQLFR